MESNRELTEQELSQLSKMITSEEVEEKVKAEEEFKQLKGWTFNRQQRRLIEKNKKKHAKKLLSKHKQGLEEISKMIDEVGYEETVNYISNMLKEIKEKENGNKEQI
jgi:hypothetical protein